MVKIVNLKDGAHIGDDDNAKSIAQALAAKTKSDKPTDIDIKDTDKLLQLLSSSEEIVVVGAGTQSIKTLSNLSQNPNITTIWSGHQQPNVLEGNDIKAIDKIILPEYAVGYGLKTFAPEKIIACDYGVPNSKTVETYLNDCKNAKNDGIIIPPAEKYLTVVLGGDAVDKAGNVREYSPTEAFDIGKMMGEQAIRDNYAVLATNGPRTGSHKNGEKTDAHNQDAPLDEVSQAFIAGLKQAGLPKAQQQFYDFRFGEKSALNALMGVVASNPKNFIYMPAESTSMISEAIENLPVGRTIIYDVNSASEEHAKQVNKVFNDGYAYRLDVANYQLQSPPKLAVQPPMRASEQAAEQVVSYLMQPKQEIAQTAQIAI